MAAPGTFAYFPQAKFAMPRSYVRGIALGISPDWEIYDTGNPIRAKAVLPSFTAFQDTYIEPRFFDWNSNSYTLDFVFTSCLFYIPGIVAPLEQSNQVEFVRRANETCFYVALYVSGATKIFYIDLPPSPTDYWMPLLSCTQVLN
jgi:hypothetical protein